MNRQFPSSTLSSLRTYCLYLGISEHLKFNILKIKLTTSLRPAFSTMQWHFLPPVRASQTVFFPNFSYLIFFQDILILLSPYPTNQGELFKMPVQSLHTHSNLRLCFGKTPKSIMQSVMPLKVWPLFPLTLSAPDTLISDYFPFILDAWIASIQLTPTHLSDVSFLSDVS